MMDQRIVAPSLLIAPTHAWGRAYLRDLAWNGSAVAGIRVVVPDDLILELAEPALGVLDPLSPAAGPWLAERALTDALAANAPERFKVLLAQKDSVLPSFPSLGSAIFQLVDRLRREGWEPETLMAAAPAGSEEKFEEMAGLLKAWNGRLVVDGWADWRRLHDFAVTALPQALTLLGAKKLILPSFWLWDRSIARFLEQLVQAFQAGGGSVEWLRGPAQDLPSGTLSHLYRLGEADAVDPEHQPLAVVFQAMAKLPEALTANWDFFCASSPSTELREGLRRALADGKTPLDQIVAYSADAAGHESAARGIAVSLGLPSTAGVSRPHAGSASAEGFRALLRWAAGGQVFAELTLGLRQGWLRTEHPFHLARSLESLNLGYGWQRAQAPSLEALRGFWAGREDEREKKVLEEARFMELKDFCQTLLNGFPDPDALVDLAEFAQWLAKQARRLTRAKDDDEATERAALLAALGSVARATRGHAPYAFDQACVLLQEALDSIKRGGQASRSGHWHLAPMGAPAEPSRGTVLLLGLDSGLFPGVLQPDPFLSDQELKALRLPTPEERVQERLAEALQTFCGVGRPQRLIVAWRSADFAEGRSKSPSSLALQLFRLKAGPEADYKDLEAAAGDPCGPFPTDAAGLLSAEEASAAFPEWAQASQEPGWAALAARRGSAATAYDGLAGKPLEGLQPRTQPWSPSSLETLLECPRKILFERFLHLDESEEAGTVPDTWLEANDAGTLLHSYYEWAARQSGWPAEKETRAKMIALFVEWELRVPTPSKALLRAQQDQLLQEALRFKAFMEKALPAGWTVDAPEFGFGGKDQPQALLKQGPLEGLPLRGKVDLILKKGSARSIWDHKTGSSRYFEKDADKLLQSGKLQMHAYVVAMQALADADGQNIHYQAGGYLFPTYRGAYAALGIDLDAAQALAGLEATLGPALNAVAQGDWQVGAEPQCGYCGYRAACDARFAVQKRVAGLEAEAAAPQAEAAPAPVQAAKPARATKGKKP